MRCGFADAPGCIECSSRELQITQANECGLLPDAYSTELEWAQFLPQSKLPPLLQRSRAYYWEPLLGISLVTVICTTLIKATSFYAGLPSLANTDLGRLAVLLIWLWAGLAVCCLLYILARAASEVQRGVKTCYPVPEDVLRCLMNGRAPYGMANIAGPNGYSYCTRCLVWRPPSSHHCRTCNRCVSQFDHHCQVLGRCITGGNLMCFNALIAMAALGFLTAAATAAVSAWIAERQVGVL
mmetsp:Transcript_69902/g.138372  ORF Transcript_69902/g.138372 Transcript_69902/m.138372 type:complete len:240 (-) Transcript_69902:259-978(-)